MKKYFISLGSGILILTIAYFASSLILSLKEKEEISFTETEKLVSVVIVNNTKNPVEITADGRIKSLNKIDIFSEVQGKINFNNNKFKKGEIFNKDEVIFSINSEEFLSSVKQARSELQNNIAKVLPDIKMDFSNNFSNWDLYFKNFDVNKNIIDLPTPMSDKEKYYLVGKGIEALFFKTKSLEKRLKKYIITAPFSGTISKTNISEGSLVSPGIPMGTFISNENFEVTFNIPSKYSGNISANQKINFNINNREFIGKIDRVDTNIDDFSQTVGVHVKITGRDLMDGMYIETKIPLNILGEGFQISRSVLFNDSYVYVVEGNNRVGMRKVDVIYYDDESVIISGLENNTKIISSNIPGIYKGMKIKTSD
jgi:multidrug efflux pump subunit AcrA (membrane-fusion protein)